MMARAGRIITFYSYKGGTGRTMALANVAWILASNGQRVLTVDWDLEAPGLHRYLRPFLIDQELQDSDGLIDLVIDFTSQLARRIPAEDEKPKDADASRVTDKWIEEHADFTRYIISLERRDFADGGRVDFLPAGRQSVSYATRVNTFDWKQFFERLDGARFFQAMREQMMREYDYILLDSRTGLSDTSGICTVLLPDDLIVCFTPNIQSIEGASAVAESVLQQRGNGKFRILPVPTRVEINEKSKLEAAHAHAERRFSKFIDKGPREIAFLRYWGDLQVQYWPFYAFEEILAPFGDLPGQHNSVLAAAERLTAYLTGGHVSELRGMTESLRKKHLNRFLRKEERHQEDLIEAERLTEVARKQAEEAQKHAEDARKQVEQLSRRQQTLVKKIAVMSIGLLALVSALFGLWQSIQTNTDWGRRRAIEHSAQDLSARTGLDSKALTAWVVSQALLSNSAEVDRTQVRLSDLGGTYGAARSYSEIAVAYLIEGNQQGYDKWARLGDQSSQKPQSLSLSYWSSHGENLALAGFPKQSNDSLGRVKSAVMSEWLPENIQDLACSAGPLLARILYLDGEKEDAYAVLSTIVDRLKSAPKPRNCSADDLTPYRAAYGNLTWDAYEIEGGFDKTHSDLQVLRAFASRAIEERDADTVSKVLKVVDGIAKDPKARKKGEIAGTSDSQYEVLVFQVHLALAYALSGQQKAAWQTLQAVRSVVPSLPEKDRALAWQLLSMGLSLSGYSQEGEQVANTYLSASNTTGSTGQRVPNARPEEDLQSFALAAAAIGRTQEGKLEEAENILLSLKPSAGRSEAIDEIAIAYTSADNLTRAAQMAALQSSDSRKLETYAHVLEAWKARSDAAWKKYLQAVRNRDNSDGLFDRLDDLTDQF